MCQGEREREREGEGEREGEHRWQSGEERMKEERGSVGEGISKRRKTLSRA